MIDGFKIGDKEPRNSRQLLLNEMLGTMLLKHWKKQYPDQIKYNIMLLVVRESKKY